MQMSKIDADFCAPKGQKRALKPRKLEEIGKKQAEIGAGGEFILFISLGDFSAFPLISLFT